MRNPFRSRTSTADRAVRTMHEQYVAEVAAHRETREQLTAQLDEAWAHIDALHAEIERTGRESHEARMAAIERHFDEAVAVTR